MSEIVLERVCSDVLLTMANAARAASRQSLFGLARETLGARYNEVACIAMRDIVKSAFTEERKTWLRLLREPLGYEAMVASIVHRSMVQVIDAARPLMGAA